MESFQSVPSFAESWKVKLPKHHKGFHAVRVVVVGLLLAGGTLLVVFNSIALASAQRHPVLQETLSQVRSIPIPGLAVCGRYAGVMNTTAMMGEIVVDPRTGNETWVNGGVSINNLLVQKDVFFPSLGGVIPASNCVLLPPSSLMLTMMPSNVISFFTRQRGSNGQVLFGAYSDVDSIDSMFGPPGSVTVHQASVLPSDVVAYIFIAQLQITRSSGRMLQQISWGLTWTPKNQTSARDPALPDETTYGQLYVYPESFYQRMQMEVTTYTISNFISDLLNITVLVTLYGILFGPGGYKPWGIFQNLYRKWRPYKFPRYASRSLSITPRSEAMCLENRLAALEKTMDVYLADADNLRAALIIASANPSRELRLSTLPSTSEPPDIEAHG